MVQRCGWGRLLPLPSGSWIHEPAQVKVAIEKPDYTSSYLASEECVSYIHCSLLKARRSSALSTGSGPSTRGPHVAANHRPQGRPVGTPACGLVLRGLVGAIGWSSASPWYAGDAAAETYEGVMYEFGAVPVTNPF